MQLSVSQDTAFGRRLPNAVIDSRAAAGHERPAALIPVSSSLKDGFWEISYRVLANAINRGAHWLTENFGPGHGETIAYIAPSDFRYQILALAAAKTGYVMFFPSPRNTPDILDKLFGDANATIYFSASEPSAAIGNIIERRGMRKRIVPSLNDFLDETLVENVPYQAIYEQVRFSPFVILHTSGSTGPPKIVPVKYGLICALDACHLLEQNEIAMRYGGMRTFTPFPPFHIAGLLYSITITLWVDGTLVTPPAGAPITADLVHNINTAVDVEHCQLAPSIVSELTQNPTWRAGLSKLKGLTFAGGPLSEATAAIVSECTPIYSSLGATEYGAIPLIPKSPEDWKYFRFNEEAAGLVFEETDQPGIFELVFRRSSNPVSQLIQSIFVTFPDVDEYRTKDCFSKHPTKPGLWKYETRIDDIVVLSNGENVSTVPMEGLISPCPAISGCVVVGQGRFQTALIVERRDQSLSESEAAKALQPFIDRANAACPSFARIAYDKLIWTKPEKPLPRAAKGTVQRGRANQVYKDEIDACYARASNLVPPSSKVQIQIGDQEATERSLLAYVRTLLFAGPDGELNVEDDFFALGMDSLQVISLVQNANLNQPDHEKHISPAFVYNHPTVKKLAAALASGKKIKDYSDFDDDDDETKDTWLSMEDTFQGLRPKDDRRRKRRSHLSDVLRSDAPGPIYQPDGGWLAWRQVLGSFLINMGNWGLVNSFGVFQAYYAATLLSDHSPSDISWIGTVQGTLLLVVGVISGPIFDKGYFRTVQIIAGLGLVFGVMMLSLSTQYYQIMLSQGILVGLCAGLLYIPSVALIPLYFKRYRGFALGIAVSGGPFGGILYPIIFRRLLSAVGFGWATRVIGFVTLFALVLATAIMKPIGPRSTRKLFETSALRDVPYLTFTATAFFTFAGVLVPFFLVTDYVAAELTLGTDLSFYALAILNAAQLFGRIIPAFLSDWFGPELILLGANLVTAIIGFCWIAADSDAGYIVWIVFYGFVSGIAVTLPAAVLPYICPSLAVIGTRLGMLYTAAGVGFLISSPIALALQRDARGFVGAQVWVGACMLVATGFFVVTAREARKRRLLYENEGYGRRASRMYTLRKTRAVERESDAESASA